jgi:Protein of unknown function (DUF2934)
MSKRTTSKPFDSPTPAPRARKAQAADAPAAPKATSSRKKAAAPVSTRPASGNGSSVAGPSYEDIAKRAYFIAMERGFQSDAVSDWLMAEQQLRATAKH